MNMEVAQLIERIMDFQIGPKQASLSFAQRLARENNWSEAYAQRAIVEYKRFMCLIMLSDKSQTPSDQVDQVWHLHMTYTESYWIDFCGNTLQRQIHHGPTRGGAKERSQYRAQYQETFDGYQALFGAPPSDIWPVPEQRFTQAAHFKRINTAEHWVLPKPKLAYFTLPFAGIAALSTAACTSQSSENPGMVATLIILGVLVAVVLIAAVVVAVKTPQQNTATNTSASQQNSTGAVVGNSTPSNTKTKPDAKADSSSNKGSDSADSNADGGCGSGCGGA
jgi:hypothetical protein